MYYFFNIDPFLKGWDEVLDGQKIKLLLIFKRFLGVKLR